VEQILLKQGVVGFHGRQPEQARQLHAGIMRDERRLDVDQIISLIFQRLGKPEDLLITHHPVFRIDRQIARNNADYVALLRGIGAIGRRDQRDLVPELPELLSEGFDRGRYTVDSRKINIGYHQNAHNTLP
jgi:hypothetical protein